ncbi:hypothetical protein MPSI1_003947 [Malassezia psittaci]|uniref:Photolyase/cryptochrome alpha/beta domain-containing protein n=1 Tax=Malassezia psittaci TaxID=1821823 RepID=A0AAF0FAF1_9BASI|nr:hypothetical protein MPSI1_003947 [Malassezia psittaci]
MVVITFLGTCLRTIDNPALKHALEDRPRGESVIACYVEDPTQRLPGAAYTWWTRHSLPLLRKKLDQLHVPLICMRGSFPAIARVLIEASNKAPCKLSRVYVNRRWGGTTEEQDKNFEDILHEQDIPVKSYVAHTLHEPWNVKTGQGGFYRVYTPFWRNFPRVKPQIFDEPEPQEQDTKGYDEVVSALKSNKEINVLDWAHAEKPYDPHWAKDFPWKPGQDQALKTLEDFLAKRVEKYKDGRNMPFSNGTSQISPYMAHGEISPHRVLHMIHQTRERVQKTKNDYALESLQQFEMEVVWREFQYHILWHEPYIGWKNHNSKFDHFPWKYPLTEKEVRENLPNANPSKESLEELARLAALDCWKAGNTGIPIVDAGMRQLWSLGWMHNRVRMIVASLLTKNLHYHWKAGEEWFWDTLVDADPASNTHNWQWVAGTGADASPYFRVFNPIRQASRFDENGNYTRHWVPELKNTATKEILKLYERPACTGKDLLENPSRASVWAQHLACIHKDAKKLGPDQQLFSRKYVAITEDKYHLPVVDLKKSKDKALEFFQSYGKTDGGPSTKKEESEGESQEEDAPKTDSEDPKTLKKEESESDSEGLRRSQRPRKAARRS